MIRTLLRSLIAAICLVLAPAIASCQSALTPELLLGPQMGAPSNQAFTAQVYFFGTPAYTNLGNTADLTDVVVQGTAITARMHPACGSSCPAENYSMHVVQLPALAPAVYTLDIVNQTGQTVAHHSLDVGGPAPPLPAAQMYTVPAQLTSGHAFALTAFFPIIAVGWNRGEGKVVGNVITGDIYAGCGFATCPPGAMLYGPATIDVPPLAAGKYTVDLIAHIGATTLRAAQFAITVQAAVAPTPVNGGTTLGLLLAAMLLAAHSHLRRPAPNHRGISHG